MKRFELGRLVGLGAAFAVASGCANMVEPQDQNGQSIVAGAGFTTFDATLAGCLDSPNGIDCNNYEAKDRVFTSGGPNAAGLSDGNYFFAVLAPGYQNGGFVQGADGNLSDTTAGATAGDLGTGDDIANRTFTVSGHQVTSYTGTHAQGTTPNGRAVIGLANFDDTDNAGGVYILAVCPVGATSARDCKFDAFRIHAGDSTPHFGVVSGAKYYDANANGQRDPGEPGIANWPINYHDGVAGTVITGADGTFSLELIADTYTFTEQLPTTGPWRQTGNIVDQTSASGGSSVALNANRSYDVTVVDDSRSSGVLFGNLCLGAGGGLTLGFWSNRNGAALFGSDDLALMVSLNLRNASGANFDPGNYAQFRTWILGATATNMAYMLSAQLATMELNVLNRFVASTALVYAPGANTANANGFTTIAQLMTEANIVLAANGSTITASPMRTYQEALKNALDRANNNLNFVQPTPATCPAPIF